MIYIRMNRTNTAAAKDDPQRSSSMRRIATVCLWSTQPTERWLNDYVFERYGKGKKLGGSKPTD